MLLPRLKPRRPVLWTSLAGLAAALLMLVLLGSSADGRAFAAEALQTIGAHLVRSTTLPNWSVYLLSLCAVACAWQVGRASGVAPRRTRAPEPAAYLRDRILNVQWEWTYDAHQQPKGLWAACPDCATRLVSFVTRPPEERRIKMFCEHCRTTLLSEPGDREVLIARVLRQIERKRRTGEWRDSQHSVTGP